MTTTETRPVDECPACGKAGAVSLSNGIRLCVHCRNEWDPNDLPDVTPAPVVALRAVPDSPIVLPQQCPACGQVMTLDAGDVYHCPNEHDPEHVAYYGGAVLALDTPAPDPLASILNDPDPIGAMRAQLVGREAVVHDLAATGTIESIGDDGNARVVFGSGYFVEVGPDDITLTELPAPTPTMDEDQQEALAATSLTIVAQIIRAGQACFVIEDGVRVVGPSPNGYLPDDPDVLPMLEWGAAYTVASLVEAWGITDEQLEATATSFDNAADAARKATEQ